MQKQHLIMLKSITSVNEWQDYLNVMNAIVSDKAFADYINNPAVAAQAKVATLKDLYNQSSPEDSNTVFKTLSTAIEGGAQVDSMLLLIFDATCRARSFGIITQYQ